MQKNKRRHQRIPADYEVVFFWEDQHGVQTARTKSRDASDSGLKVESAVSIQSGTQVCVEIPRYGTAIEGIVRYCNAEGAVFQIGVEFSSESRSSSQPESKEIDYYEVLQLSSKADLETIHRVYRIMAARFHPDNPESGNHERFLLLSEAYRVLCDPILRAEYDLARATNTKGPLPLFQAKAFVDEKEGETHRRLGVLCLLYAQRRRNPRHPTITLVELEELMSIPRDYLEFTLWYLKQKRLVEMNDGADFSLTAAGVDFVEEHTPAQDILHRLLTSGGRTAAYPPPAERAAHSASVQ